MRHILHYLTYWAAIFLVILKMFLNAINMRRVECTVVLMGLKPMYKLKGNGETYKQQRLIGRMMDDVCI